MGNTIKKASNCRSMPKQAREMAPSMEPNPKDMSSPSVNVSSGVLHVISQVRKKFEWIDARVVSFVIIGASLLFTLWATASTFLHQRNLSAESSVIENVQACLLIAACLVYLYKAILKKGSEKIVPLFCSWLCYCFALREMDLKNMDLPYVLSFLGSAAGRNISITLGLVALIVFTVLSKIQYVNTALGFIKSRAGKLLIWGGVFILIGDLFEKKFTFTNSLFCEEISEFFAYVFILLSAVAIPSFVNSLSNRSNIGDENHR